MSEVKDVLIELQPTGTIPVKSHETDAGYDLFSNEREYLPARSQTLVTTGIHIKIPQGFVGQIWPRSGWDSKKDIGTGAGVLDPGYTGEVHVLLYNKGEKDKYVNSGDRIAQLLIVPVQTVRFVEVNSLPETNRGKGGFGSTGR